MSLLRLADCPPQPWKNGLGSTRELAVDPPAAGADNFVWRVSVATVDSAGPFSLFPGVDRQIVLLRGAGFRMTLDGQQSHVLDQPFVPFAFPGEARVATTLLGGPTEDFNLMVCREQARGTLEVWRGPRRDVLAATTVLVYCAAGSLDIAGERLQAGDAWRVVSAGPVQSVLPAGAVALVVGVRAR